MTETKLNQYFVDGTYLPRLEEIFNGSARKDSTTGVRGVYCRYGKYVAELKFRGKHYWLGSYDKLEDAVQARNRGIKEIIYSHLSVESADEVLQELEKLRESDPDKPADEHVPDEPPTPSEHADTCEGD